MTSLLTYVGSLGIWMLLWIIVLDVTDDPPPSVCFLIDKWMRWLGEGEASGIAFAVCWVILFMILPGFCIGHIVTILFPS